MICIIDRFAYQALILRRNAPYDATRSESAESCCVPNGIAAACSCASPGCWADALAPVARDGFIRWRT